MSEIPIKQAKNRAWWLLEKAEAALAAGEITEDEWYREVAAAITPAYLGADNPRSRSGSSSDEAGWRYSRELVVDALDRDGTFLDVGCASGHLMECVQQWAGERGRRIEPYGLDIAPELAELARHRLPHWAERIFMGNALSWVPPGRFDFVRTGLEYVPVRRQGDLVAHLLEHVVAPGGRLIIGVFPEERDETRQEPSEEERVAGWGYRIAGRSERPRLRDPRILYRAFWIDRVMPPAPGRQ